MTISSLEIINPNMPIPIQGCVPFVVGTPQTALRAIVLSITAAGTVTVQFADTSTLTLSLQIGVFEFPWAVTQITAATAAGSFYNLY